jgi:hypothetical protein
MLTWEREPAAIKKDFDLAKTHFEAIVNATDTYKQNAGGGTAGRNRYKSANQMADYGDEIREYIQQLASASAANNATNTAVNIQTTNKLTTMEAEIKKLTATIASMATKLNSKNINPNSGNRDGRERDGRPQMKKTPEHGSLLQLAWFSSNWNQSRQRDLHLQKTRAQERSHMVQQARGRHVLAQCQARCSGTTRSPIVERKAGSHQLTSTGDCKHKHQQHSTV